MDKNSSHMVAAKEVNQSVLEHVWIGFHSSIDGTSQFQDCFVDHGADIFEDLVL